MARTVALLIAVSLVSIPSAYAEDWTTTNGKTYKDVTVVKFDAQSVTILDADGGASVSLADLPANLQQKFHYDPKAAAALKAQEDAQAAADAKAQQAVAAAKAQDEAKAAADVKAKKDAQAAADAATAKAAAEQKQQREALNLKAKTDFDAAEKANVSGQVFITTKGGDAVKLSSIHIYLFSADQIHAAITPLVEVSLQQQAKMQSDLDKAKDAFTKVVNAAEAPSADENTFEQLQKNKSDAETFYEKILTNSYHYQSQDYYTATLPAPLADAESDSNGNFILSVPKTGSWVIEATGERSVGEKVEGYFWLTKIRADAVSKNQILLDNDNLATSNSPDSMVYALDKYTEIEAVANEIAIIENQAMLNQSKPAEQ